MKPVVAGMLVAALAGCDAQNGGGFVTVGGVRVNPVSATVFEVIARPGEEKHGLWCGAGQYARHELGAANSATVFVVGGAGRGVTADSPSAAQFSLLPPGQAEGATGRRSNWGPQPGMGTTVGSASRQCGRQQRSDD